jgi:hypothetical protein
LIEVIFGEKGTGKTKHILDLANKTAKEAKGSIVFIDSDSSYMYDLSTSIRFINVSDYEICTPKMLFGFLSGLAAMDFDLEYIFIDGFVAITHHEIESLEGLFKQLTLFSQKQHVNIIASINGNPSSVPDFLKGNVMHTL